MSRSVFISEKKQKILINQDSQNFLLDFSLCDTSPTFGDFEFVSDYKHILGLVIINNIFYLLYTTEEEFKGFYYVNNKEINIMRILDVRYTTFANSNDNIDIENICTFIRSNHFYLSDVYFEADCFSWNSAILDILDSKLVFFSPYNQKKVGISKTKISEKYFRNKSEKSECFSRMSGSDLARTNLSKNSITKTQNTSGNEEICKFKGLKATENKNILSNQNVSFISISENNSIQTLHENNQENKLFETKNWDLNSEKTLKCKIMKNKQKLKSNKNNEIHLHKKDVLGSYLNENGLFSASEKVLLSKTNKNENTKNLSKKQVECFKNVFESIRDTSSSLHSNDSHSSDIHSGYSHSDDSHSSCPHSFHTTPDNKKGSFYLTELDNTENKPPENIEFKKFQAIQKISNSDLFSRNEFLSISDDEEIERPMKNFSKNYTNPNISKENTRTMDNTKTNKHISESINNYTEDNFCTGLKSQRSCVSKKDENNKFSEMRINNKDKKADLIYSQKLSNPSVKIKNHTEFFESTKSSELNTHSEFINESDDNNFEDWSDSNSCSENQTRFHIAFVFSGYFESYTHHEKIHNILSMVSTNKIGPRFYCRGVDESGNVSFFVQTSIQIYDLKKHKMFQKTLLRGSIPLFWYQDTNPLRKNLKYTCEAIIAEQTFQKHFKRLNRHYLAKLNACEIVVVNLLRNNSTNESELTEKYETMLYANKIPFIHFDLNKYSNNFGKLKRILWNMLGSIENINDKIFRVNCLDCLDRTNVAQSLITEYYLENNNMNEAKNIFKRFFQSNGHSLSNLYAGSDSLKSELPLREKRSLGGRIDDILINANRIFKGKFDDESKNKTIGLLLQKPEKRSVCLKSQNISKLTSITNFQNLQILILNWCLNSHKTKDLPFLTLNTEFNPDIVFVSVQKIQTSLKRLFLDQKQTERADLVEYLSKWATTMFPEMNIISQSFTNHIGIILFGKKEVSQKISNIQMKKNKKELFMKNCSLNIKFTILNESYSFSNIYFSAEDEKWKERLHENIRNLIIKKDCKSNCFVTGFFKVPNYDISTAEILQNIESLKYDLITDHDVVGSVFKTALGDTITEEPINFSPNGNFKTNSFLYFSRIFHPTSFRCAKYTDVLEYTTGFRPIYGFFSKKIE